MIDVGACLLILTYSALLVWSAWAHDLVATSTLILAMGLGLVRRPWSVLLSVMLLAFWLAWTVVRLVREAL